MDKTYVSRSSGGLSSFSGTTLNDRYNYQQLSTFWSQQRATSRTTDWLYKFEYRIKDYEDYTAIGVSNLDYQLFTLTNQLDHKINKKHQQQVELKLSHREYKDKRQQDIEGNDIINSELTYLDTALGYEYSWQQKKRHNLAMSLDYVIRKDNGSGYYDSQKSTLKVTSKYRLNSKVSFTTQYQFIDFSYDRPSVKATDATTEDYSSHQQHRVKINSRFKLDRYLPITTQWLMGYQYVNEDSNTPQYTYERHIIETGLSFKF